MQNGKDVIGSALFGAREQIDVDRALAEIRAGRPFVVADNHQSIIALPVEGLTAERLAAFRQLCAPLLPRVIITSQRAASMGFDATGPMALTLPADADVETIGEIAADATGEWDFDVKLAEAAAAAAVDLVKLAQGLPAILAADAHAPKVAALDPRPVAIEAGAVARFRASLTHSLTIAGEARVPLASGVSTRFVVFRDGMANSSVAVIIGKPDATKPVAVRMHSACLTGDVFGSRRCDCGDQLRLALAHIEAAGSGIILYLAQEGRGLGLVNKMRAYRLQDLGLDTIDANTTLGFDDDERDYGIAARMLELLGITRVRLLTNNPAKLEGLSKAGIKVAGRMPLEAPVTADNRRYLTAKASRAGHQLEHLLTALRVPSEQERGAGGGRSPEAVAAPVKSQA
jgi:GTP cyclohydrolase II